MPTAPVKLIPKILKNGNVLDPMSSEVINEKMYKATNISVLKVIFKFICLAIYTGYFTLKMDILIDGYWLDMLR